MKTRNLFLYSSALSVLFLFADSASADKHAEEALQHADDAIRSAGDSQSIRTHAAEALKHIEAAKRANSQRPEVVEHLEKGEAELKNAIEHASHYNPASAADTASQARTHIEDAIENADDRQVGTKPSSPAAVDK